MRRTLVLLALVVLAGCGTTASGPIAAARPAEAQHLRLDWRETYPASGRQLVFAVDEVNVTTEGWSARVAVANETRVPFLAGGEPAALAYGVMLFATGDLDELEQAAAGGTLPAVRKAETIEPALPAVLEPGATWRGTLAASGSLADGSWLRIAFGPLRVQGDPPQGMQPVVLWITDRAHRL